MKRHCRSSSELILETPETMITQSVFQELEKQKAKLSMDQVEEKTNANKIKSQVKRKLKLQMLVLEKNHK